jgi:hypothetical protein
VRVPSAPVAFTAERRSGIIDVTFTVPSANADGTRPANLARIDIYALTGPATIGDEQVIRLGTRIASLAVKAPRDPSDVIEPDDSAADLAPLVGSGLDQGAAGRVREEVSTLEPAAASAEGEPVVRHYVGVSVNTRGRRGLASKGVAVPLGQSPDPPGEPQVHYDERSITVTWPSVSGALVRYHVYSPDRSAQDQPTATRLTAMPIAGREFVDSRVEWGADRCYAVSVVDARDGLPLESDPGPSTCVTLVDTFAPRVPVGLTAVGSDAAINLAWDANPEVDLFGYLILRGTAPEGLATITPAPITETTFRDPVPEASHYFYAVRAVDKSGNPSPASETVEATAR